ncbi:MULTISPECIES: DUF4132 domain-containing protein [unclassified Arcicella]|uniref:DUF4132 domain-containing protein n=1 Tax=unclassified Arcicella TaxID=2644986 RepID=UPI00285EEDF7|nr:MULTISPECIES: DUF4132 domain-containing protein [unclassified Arcicella]MDR6560016.1 hypothetical protein [Arcicella sp. BE51]MDR6810377.1 hypothetical protein [Arcicella sp. BE140]MDR6821727.1 hypothetical protein [Arcicella sp. BE139]
MFNKIKDMIFGTNSSKYHSVEITSLLNQLIDEAIKEGWSDINPKLSGLTAYGLIQEKDTVFKSNLMILLLDEIANSGDNWNLNLNERRENSIKSTLLNIILRTNLLLNEKQIIDAVDIYLKSKKQGSFPLEMFIKQLHFSNKETPFSDEVKQKLTKIYDVLKSNRYNKRKALAIYEFLVPSNENNINPVFADSKDEVGQEINRFIASTDATEQTVLYQLLALFKTATSGKPTNKFLKEVANICSAIDKQRYLAIIRDWLILVKKLKPTIEEHTSHYGGREHTWVNATFLEEINSSIIKGCVWSLLTFEENDANIVLLLSEVAQKCHTKIPGKGPAAAGVGNACIYVLAQSGMRGVSQLSRLKLRIKQASSQELLQKYIIEASEKIGVSPEEIEDMSVSNFGLEKGTLTENFGDYTATLTICAVGKTEIKWTKQEGSSLKTEPSVVKKTFADELKEFKDVNVQIQKMLSAQRDRLDRMLIQDRIWTWDDFNQYYAEHGLMSYLSDLLVWEFINDNITISAFKLNGQWVSVDEKLIENIDSKTLVKLWHPVDKPIAEVTAWRNVFANYQIKQPIKQVYREVYLLTDAEISTLNYSNRMAAHILKQHQFNTLAKLRGWKYSLLGAYDKGYESEIARINLPKYNLRAEFWVSEVNANDAWNDTGIWHYISTDQVRFINNNDITINLIDVPPIVFSEIMRDVDLFVGVASVGNDPEWRDNGGLQQFRNYWESYSFGELGELAKTRKEILLRLIPRLKIAKVAEVKDKFVIVKGEFRIYKIHIGSGNILMEPNDQYLCIVPDRSAKNIGSETVFLPFEGDAVLSIILSKALLLAEDDKIIDTTITRQIKAIF